MVLDARALLREIDSSMRCDQHRFRSRLNKLKKSTARTDQKTADQKSTGQKSIGQKSAEQESGNQKHREAEIQLRNDIAASTTRRQNRQASLPVPEYPQELPIVQHRTEIIEAIRTLSLIHI